MSLTLFILMCFAVYRITRFLILDHLIDEPRDAVHLWLAGHPNKFTEKLQELLACPYCVSVWAAAAVVALTDLFHSVPLPVLMWGAVAGGSLIPYRIIDAED